MRTRNADNPKSPPPAKRTPPARKSATKTPPTPPPHASVTRNDTTATTPETPVSAIKPQDDTVKVTPRPKRTVKKVVKKTVIRKKPKSQPDLVEVEKDDNELLLTEKDSFEEVNDMAHDDVCMPLKDDEDTMKDVEEGNDVGKAIDYQEPEVKENKETIDDESLKIQEPFIEARIEEEEEPEEEPEEEQQPIENQEITMEKEKKAETEEEPMECCDDEVDMNEQLIENQEIIMEKEKKVEKIEEEDQQERVCLSDEEKDNENDNEIDNDVNHEEEDEKGVQQECKVAVEDRKRRKEFEIFVGGLDRDATEEEVKKAFEYVGEVVDIRMHKEVATNKNKGFAFVRFANKEQVARALAEMKNPVIHGKRCGTAPSEDNDTLFLGNICNTWTTEAIRQKLKDYGVEALEKLTLVPNPHHEGLSRGFAFLEFSSHPDAMLAYKRLQKPDAVFGHPDRSVKVAFAEPLRDPDPEVLKEVKSVFVDGLPPHWDEDAVRVFLKEYGSIERVMLARNMSTAKRKDFGFVDFSSHEAALACVDGLNNRELGDEKIKVKARLSNPSPKTQAVKGGIAGGFRIGRHGSGPTFPRPGGRGFGRSSFPNNTRMEYERGGRGGFYQHGHGQFGQTSRMGGYAEDYPPPGPHPSFRGRHNFGRGGRWNDYRGPHQQYQGTNMPPRYDYDRHRPPMHDHHHHPMSMRGQPPFMGEEEFNRPYGGERPYEDHHPYMYGGDTSRGGIKRSYYPEPDHPEYMEPSRGRPRLDHAESASSGPGPRLRGGGSGMHPRDYYNYDYEGSYSSYYGGDRPYGGRYYY